jgi:tetratricopeptide (TPR) repeat protein
LTCAIVLAAFADQPPWRDDLEAGKRMAAKGNYQEAEAKLLAAVRKVQSSGARSEGAALAYNEAAALYQLLGRYPQAETFFQRAVVAWENAHPERTAGLIRILNNLGALYLNQGQFGKAERTCRRALALEMRTDGLEAADRARLHGNLGGLYCARKNYVEAESEYRRALTMWEEHEHPEHPEVAAVLNNLSVMFTVSGRPAEAISYLERSVAIGRKTSALAFGLTVQLDNLGTLYTATGKLQDGKRAFEEALRIAEQHPALVKPRLPGLLSNYAALLRKMNQHAEGKTLELKAQAIRREVALQDPSRYTIDARDLAAKK